VTSRIDAEGTIQFQADPNAYGRWLCAHMHPIALNLGTIAPGEPCCRNCTLFPQPDDQPEDT
jgi:hypothetical protein